MNQTSNPNIPTIKRWSRPSLAPVALQHAWPLRDQMNMNRFIAGFVPFCVIPDPCFASCLDLCRIRFIRTRLEVAISLKSNVDLGIMQSVFYLIAAALTASNRMEQAA